MRYRNNMILLLSSLSLFTASCSQSGYQVNFNSTYSYTATPGVIGGNVITLDVGAAYANSLTTRLASVTVCIPGTATCNTIGPLLVDTGSTGLRVDSAHLTARGLGALATTTDSYGNLQGTCVVYGDASYHWGPVKSASVQLGSEVAATMPIQSIDYNFGDAGAQCQQNAGMVVHQDSFTANYKGIIGIKFFKQDCGTACLSNAGNTIPSYYGCTLAASGTCGMIAMPLASQLQNPIAMLAGDNNGYLIDLSTMPNGTTGSSSVTGLLYFGVGTQSNNTPPNTVTKLVADPSYGNVAAVFNGSTIPAIIDSGSNANYFQYNGSKCTALNQTAFFCPATSWSFSVKLLGYIGANYINTTVPVGNYTTLLSYANTAYYNIAGSIPAGLSGTFDLGLPFFFGKKIYYGMEQSATSLGNGPYIAF